jgi:DNA adenine methylase
MAFGYCGGKARLSLTIADFLNIADTSFYVEPFGGSAAVLLNKVPHKQELYADRSLPLCCFWQCMSESETAHALIERLGGTTCDETAFNGSRALLDRAGDLEMRALSGDEILSIAAACFVVHTLSRDNSGFRYSKGRFPTNDAYLRTVGRLGEVAIRFSGVLVRNADAFDLLDTEFNDSGTLLYLDPVYLSETGRPRSRNQTFYRHHFSYADHVVLLERIRKMRSRILISGYVDDTQLYDRYLVDGENCTRGDFKAWRRYEIETTSTAARGDKSRTEVLWANYS